MRTARDEPMTQARQDAEHRGRRAEALSALWLRLTGWRILDQRVRTGAGELDLVARRGAVLAFIEVKHRQTLEQARQAIPRRQQERLMRAASLWRSHHPECASLQPRFDVMLWGRRSWPRHIQGAFVVDGASLSRLV